MLNNANAFLSCSLDFFVNDDDKVQIQIHKSIQFPDGDRMGNIIK